MAYKVHIAYGFHVNCYHSYRGDTNDKKGFGGDIRIIRKIINVLNEFNENGIPVKGTWDFENGYSLEDILPKYAPDIIENIKTRVKLYGDENIIMGYNNGALSAMNEDELAASINWAVTNEKGSGLKDIFGECEMIVRPQEVMFSPSQVSVYNKLGVKALCLYYSCVPFDAFRTFIPQLKDEYAFNPVSYVYKGEKLTVIPTYNNADIVDSGSLRYLACDLHKQQLEGKINNDVLIFINMDADAIFWETLLPKPFCEIPHTDGIHGLVKEVADLDFVEFNTVGGYLKNHEPLCDITFNQDTADGGFSGYISWSEKPFNCQIWTRLERARAYAKLYSEDSLSPSFNDRIMLLSTTHFGLASPVLNVQREKAALEMSERMVKSELSEQKPKEKLVLKNISGSEITSVQLSIKDGFLKSIENLEINSSDIENYVAHAMDKYENGCVKTVFAVIRFKSLKEEYELEFSNNKSHECKQLSKKLGTDKFSIRFTDSGKISEVRYKGKKIGDINFLNGFINYDGMSRLFVANEFKPLKLSGNGEGLSIKGRLHLPTELEGGFFNYNFYTLDGIDAVFMSTHIKYPYTKEDTEISTESSALGRKTDNKWIEAVPNAIKPILKNNISVVKRNYMDDISAYSVSDFGKIIPENKELDSFNHHLTNGMIALSDGETGFAVLQAKQVQSSMADCPMRLRVRNGKQEVTMNPFGTFYGKQRKYPSRGNGCAAASFIMVTPQSRSIAPSYNGVEQWTCMALMPYDGLIPDETAMNVMKGFSEGSAAVNGNDENVTVFIGDNVNFKAIQHNFVRDDELKSPIVTGTVGTLTETAKLAVKVMHSILGAKIKARKGRIK